MCSSFRLSQKFLCWRSFENTVLRSLYLPIGKLLFVAGLPKTICCHVILFSIYSVVFIFYMICLSFWFNWKCINCFWRHFPTLKEKHIFSSNVKKKSQNLACLIVSKQNISDRYNSYLHQYSSKVVLWAVWAQPCSTEGFCNIKILNQ